ncbi:hypothetical protein ACIP2X_09930 [Streptomyces sp. NPDC089424]|uniref:hypothetical protein n=1 Tax=Streptomyces sp. NPDC089424 TaxID=3365917 RepID=UPI0037F5B8A4
MGRIRRRGQLCLVAGALGLAGGLVWFLVGDAVDGPLGVTLYGVVASLTGVAYLWKARRPFRLRVDGFGITLHDAELAWEQIDRVALWHPPNTGENSVDTKPPKPHLRLWTAPGVTLSRRPDHTFDGLPRYTIVDCGDLDQSVSALTAELARHGGARFETAPRTVRLPVPVTRSGPERRIPGGEHHLAPRSRAGVWTAFWAASAAVCTFLLVQFVVHQRLIGPFALLPVATMGTLLSWPLAVRYFQRWRRPLRLRVGPEGIGMRKVAKQELFLYWDEIAAVTMGPEPFSKDARPWLVVWLLPGTTLRAAPTHLVDGHQAYALVRVDRLPGGAPAVRDAVQPYAGERYSEPLRPPL